MLGEILSAVAGPLIGGLFGKKQQAPVPVDGSMAPSQVPAPPAPVPPLPPPKGLADRLRAAGQDFFGAMVDDASKTARSAIFGGVQSRLQGSQRKDYLDAAFPGTTPWEQLGAGAAGSSDGYQQMAQQSEELAQRERESKRQSSVTLSTARIQAAQQLAGSFIQNGNYEAAERMLKAAGVFDPALGIDERMMANGRVASEIRRIDQETHRSQEMLPFDRAASHSRAKADDAAADKSRVDAMMAPLRLALDDWIARDKGGHITNEIRGAVGVIREVLNGISGPVDETRFNDIAAKVLRGSDLPGDVIDDLLKKLRSP